ncbi:hypothetical protein F0562_028758 [Nyssa sinensis]|uniref:GH10 domain-containing protein n=1 Tax=Nyssa sinensis TaxID=561372 RepID=A0A5J5B153_9ASTE|nr:hypothetical protein F0562_028758 [Nyssa sinensis]
MGIQVRGHNILWEDPSFQPEWVKTLSPAELSSAATKRLTSIVRRYARQLIAWDVVNENLHFSFFESKLGQNASAAFYRLAHQLDPATTLFLNDYNTIEDMRDPASTPAAYLRKIRQIQSTGFNGLLGIGLEAHFKSPPNLPYIRASIDQLAAARLPIWLTELDVSWSPQQASYLEQILREAHAHPAVNGIVIWAAWKPEGCYQMCLTDNNFRNLPTGDVVDKLMREWKQDGSIGTTDTEGIFETSLFHGDYELTITHSGVTNSSSAQSLKVASRDKSQQTLHVKVSS